MSRSYLEMSDDEILAMGKAPRPEPEAEVVKTTEELEAEAAAATEAANATAATEQDNGEVDDTTAETNQDDQVPGDDDVDDDTAAATGKNPTADDGNVTDPVTAPVKPAKKADAAPITDGLPEDAGRIFQSFRANGKDMQVRSTDEAIRLMQMGANFSQKNAELKPKMAIIKVLEKNGLLDSEKLAYLIDLHNKNPEAIGKLVKDSGIDAHDLVDKDVSGYKPQVRKASDAELELDDVLSDLKHSTHYDRILDVVSNKWDERSKAAAGSNPRVLAMLNEQMDSGIYDKIMAEVDHRRMLGDLAGVPILQAYDDIGKELNAKGAFAPAVKVPVKKLVTPGKKPVAGETVDEQRRRAAAPTKAASTAAKEAPGPSPLSMSDADFLKQTKR